MSVDISVREMLEAGVHFGHQTHRWDPRMKPYIYGARNGIYIIDLQKTVPLCRAACDFLTKVVSEGGEVLFVGTKKQAQVIVQEEATRGQAYSVTHRWLGGTLTNFKTIKTAIDRLRDLEEKQKTGGLEGLTKKEKLGVEKEVEKLTKTLGGIRNMNRPPAALFIIDPGKEHIAKKEANRLGIPVVAVADTNCNPEGIDYLVPGNDDAIKSIRLFAAKAAEACLQGLAARQEVLRDQMEQEAEGKSHTRTAAGAKGVAYVSKADEFEEKTDGVFRAAGNGEAGIRPAGARPAGARQGQK